MTLRPYFCFVLWLSIASSTSFADFIPKKIATSLYTTCVLSTEGAIKCWGENSDGQLGTGNTEEVGGATGTMGNNLKPIDLGLSETDKAVDVCTAPAFTCALTQMGKVKCWGDNMSGELGQGVEANRVFTMGKALPFCDLGKNFKVRSIACGDSHACALSDQGLVKCWGENKRGQLGLGDKLNRGKSPENMGDKLPTLAGLNKIQAVSTGHDHSCALSTDGLRCWGAGEHGQLGLESGQDRATTPDTIPGKSPEISLTANQNEKILSVTAGDISTCALMTEKNAGGLSKPFAKCWGFNGWGALGAGNKVHYGLDRGTMGAMLSRVNTALDDIVSLNAHIYHSCALSKSGRVKCWGDNSTGNLGLGDTLARGAAPSEMGAALPDVNLGLPAKAISSGSSLHSCAILINNQIKCWGRGNEGQLGYENTDFLGTMPSDMGDALPFVRLK